MMIMKQGSKKEIDGYIIKYVTVDGEVFNAKFFASQTADIKRLIAKLQRDNNVLLIHINAVKTLATLERGNVAELFTYSNKMHNTTAFTPLKDITKIFKEDHHADHNRATRQDRSARTVGKGSANPDRPDAHVD